MARGIEKTRIFCGEVDYFQSNHNFRNVPNLTELQITPLTMISQIYFISLGFRQSEIATNRLFPTSALKNLTISEGAWLFDV